MAGTDGPSVEREEREEEVLSVTLEDVEFDPSLPRARVLAQLLGLPGELDEAAARALWEEAAAHRHRLGAQLGRAVGMRTALVDLASGLLEGQDFGPTLQALMRDALAPLLKLPATDQLTGLMRRDTFLALLQHELHQRQPAPLAVLSLRVTWQRALEAQPVRREEVLGLVGRLLPRRLRKSDAVTRLEEGVFAALLTGCRPEKASAIAGHLEGTVKRLFPGLSLGLRVGVTQAERGERAEAVLARAARLREEAHQAHEARREALRALPPSAAADRPLALYLGTSAATYLELQRAFCGRGTPLLWARERATAAGLLAAVEPTLLLADVMLPPGGGLPALQELLAAGPAPTGATPPGPAATGGRPAGALVAPRAWATLHKAEGRTATQPSLALPVLALPLDGGQLEPGLAAPLGPPAAPFPPLESETAALVLAAALRTLAHGGAVPEAQLLSLGPRPELDAVRSRLAPLPAP
jgi:GGDEF domain-containing protein